MKNTKTNMTDAEKLFEQACSLMPGGVNSPVRAYGAVGGTPPFIEKGQGAYLWNSTGKRYIDYVGAFGPAILGHAPESVVGAIQAAAQKGTAFGAPTIAEIDLARRVTQLNPNLEMIRLVNSGTEACLTALRLVRAGTGKNKFLVKAGSGAITFGVPDSPGVPESTVADTLIATFNDIPSVETLIDQNPGHIAAVILEPVIGNAGLIPPVPNFLQELRELTKTHGILLIFDEVMTGFRLGPGSAQQLYQIQCDLTTLGKIIGGGLPIGAIAGKKELLNQLAPAGPVYQAGTLSGNPIAVAAGLATLDLLNPQLYQLLEQRSVQLETGIKKNLLSLNMPYQFQRIGSMACLFFTDKPVKNFDDALTCDRDIFARYFHSMLDQGIMLPPSQFEAFFICAAHSEQDIEETIAANAGALKSLSGI